jgi:prepilin-type N-terminal cleavage/methylation domain-containing protein
MERHAFHRAVPRSPRRAFNVVELLVALAISGILLAATMVALDASFMAYQSTTEVASTHTISRLAMHRMLTMIRTGTEFAPRPADPLEPIEESEFIDFRLQDGEVVTFEWDDVEEALYIRVGGPDEPRYAILEGVIEQTFPAGHPSGARRSTSPCSPTTT